jgi:hypothetical protein
VETAGNRNLQTRTYKVIFKPIWTYGIQLWGTTSNSNIDILERFQSKVLRLTVDAPWYVLNSVIRNDHQILTFKEEISRFNSHYNVCITVHPNELIASLTEPPIQRLLCRYWISYMALKSPPPQKFMYLPYCYSDCNKLTNICCLFRPTLSLTNLHIQE